MEELTLKIGLFCHECSDEVDVCVAENAENFQKSLVKLLFYGNGPDLRHIQALLGPDLVRIGTKKWSGFGPILTNLGPI